MTSRDYQLLRERNGVEADMAVGGLTLVWRGSQQGKPIEHIATEPWRFYAWGVEAIRTSQRVNFKALIRQEGQPPSKASMGEQVPQEGWASTKPGHTKYHHYDAKGKSKCNYQRQPGPLHFAPDPKQLRPEDCCSSCDLHILKAKHPERFNAHPTLPVARQSAWQQKQYVAMVPEAKAPPEKPANTAPSPQLSFF